MSARVGWLIIAVLAIVIVILAALLFASPASSPSSGAAVAPSSASQPFMSEKVKVSSPLPSGTVSKTFTVVGQARGTWYFEASFPVQVRDSQNNLVGSGLAQAQSDWMTENFVPFTVLVTVNAYSGPATLVLIKDNPSGLPENEDSVEFPIAIQ